MKKVRWGILSTADFGVQISVPAMQQGELYEVVAIASRSMDKAQAVASKLGIPKSYGSYQELLADPDIDAIYNPLPNHLHVPWSIKALESGKHVLCEKPIAMTSTQAQELVNAARAHTGLKVMEAFMYRHHPQWQHALRLVRQGQIGKLRAIQSFFSYYNDDPNNIRNMKEIGGGVLMDIGCYCISLSRFIFGDEPEKAWGWIEFDPNFGIDRLASAVLDFKEGRSTFTCSTQMGNYQRVTILGTEGWITIEIPFNAPPDKPCRLWHERVGKTEEVIFETVNQYTIQGNLFSKAILEDTEVFTPIEDAVANMKVIEAVFKSDKVGGWVNV
jgi:predicted dehydrogenase